MTKEKTLSFEKSLEALESIVKKMDTGEMALEDSLAAFEEGIRLIRDCQQSLAKAEQKIQVLTEQNTGLTLSPLDDEQD